MMDNDCFALMLGGESQTVCMSWYQFGGSSNSVEPLAPEDWGVWRCLVVEKLSQVELRTGTWHTESRPPRQTCIDETDFNADAQPEADPQ